MQQQQEEQQQHQRRGVSFTMEEKLRCLRETFHYDKFRPGQRTTVDLSLAGANIIAIMPTGAGKSITYWLPQVLLNRGVTLVVSPLISLINDQCQKLESLKINCLQVTSSKRRDARIVAFLRGGQAVDDAPAEEAPARPIINPSVRFIYTTPEKIVHSTAMLAKLRQLQQAGMLTRVVVDECHAVVQWGFGFRKSYVAFIKKLLDTFGDNVAWSFYSATITDRELQQIRNLIRPKLSDLYLLPLYERRSNLIWSTCNVNYKDTFIVGRCMRNIKLLLAANGELAQLFDWEGHFSKSLTECPRCSSQNIVTSNDPANPGSILVNGLPASGQFLARAACIVHLLQLRRVPMRCIVYCNTINDVTRLAGLLRNNGIHDVFEYESSETGLKRTVAQRNFSSPSIPDCVMVATEAFGVGVDVADVRLVINCDTSRSFSDFAQHVGRAGRDGKKALALTLYTYDDHRRAKRMMKKSLAKGERDSSYTQFEVESSYAMLLNLQDDEYCRKVQSDYIFTNFSGIEQSPPQQQQRHLEACKTECDVCVLRYFNADLSKHFPYEASVSLPLFPANVMLLRTIGEYMRRQEAEHCPLFTLMQVLAGNRGSIIAYTGHHQQPQPLYNLVNYGCLAAWNELTLMKLLRWMERHSLIVVYSVEEVSVSAAAAAASSDGERAPPIEIRTAKFPLQQVNPLLSLQRKNFTVCVAVNPSNEYAVRAAANGELGALSPAEYAGFTGARIVCSYEFAYLQNVTADAYEMRFRKKLLRLHLQRYCQAADNSVQYNYAASCYLSKKFLGRMSRIVDLDTCMKAVTEIAAQLSSKRQQRKAQSKATRRSSEPAVEMEMDEDEDEGEEEEEDEGDEDEEEEDLEMVVVAEAEAEEERPSTTWYLTDRELNGYVAECCRLINDHLGLVMAHEAPAAGLDAAAPILDPSEISLRPPPPLIVHKMPRVVPENFTAAIEAASANEIAMVRTLRDSPFLTSNLLQCDQQHQQQRPHQRHRWNNNLDQYWSTKERELCRLDVAAAANNQQHAQISLPLEDNYIYASPQLLVAHDMAKLYRVNSKLVVSSTLPVYPAMQLRRYLQEMTVQRLHAGRRHSSVAFLLLYEQQALRLIVALFTALWAAFERSSPDAEACCRASYDAVAVRTTRLPLLPRRPGRPPSAPTARRVADNSVSRAEQTAIVKFALFAGMFDQVQVWPQSPNIFLLDYYHEIMHLVLCLHSCTTCSLAFVKDLLYRVLPREFGCGKAPSRDIFGVSLTDNEMQLLFCYYKPLLQIQSR